MAPDRSTRRKTALVTGASSGIGAALLPLFAQDRYNLVLVARDREALQHQADALTRAWSVTVTVLARDLAQPQAVEEVVAAVREAAIPIDVLVNSAEFTTCGPLRETELQAELEMIQASIVALTHLTKLLMPDMVRRHDGKILNVASTAAFWPDPALVVCAATSAYILAFSEALANELHGTGVSVTALCPGFPRADARQGGQIAEAHRRRTGALDIEAVAREGYYSCMANQTLVIPGLRDKATVLATRFLPRRLVNRLARAAQRHAATP